MSCIEQRVCAWAPEIGVRVKSVVWVAFAAMAVSLVAVEQSQAQVSAVIDRATGNISLSQSGGGSSLLKGYTLVSESGFLSPDTWNSLEDQSISGWGEANPRPQQLSELNLEESTALADGDSWSLGNAFVGVVPPSGEDVTLEYWLADGSILTGAVEYTGPANDLVLNVDSNGAVTLQNLSALTGDFVVTGYNIFSDSGSLIPANFTGIGEDGWVNSNPKSTSLAELNFDGSKVFSAGTVVSLGNIFDVNGTPDLRIEYGNAALESRVGTVQYADQDVVVCEPINELLGDLNGDGTVDFPDFLKLSGNFGLDVDRYEDGDINCDGKVDFPDFLALSGNFGKSLPAAGAAAAVPEPSMGILALIGFVSLFGFRRSQKMQKVVGLCLVLGLMGAVSKQSIAEDFDTRFIRLDPAGTNNQINSTAEARDLVRDVPEDAEDGAAVGDYIIAENLTGKLDIIDLAGGPGDFTFINNPYLNGVNDNSMVDFLQYVSGTLVIPEGEWAIGFASDDGGFLNMPSISFIETFNENGSTIAGDGEILFNGTRGHSWTGGNFVVPAGGITTAFEALMFERGGGDSFEVVVVSEFVGTVEGVSAAQDFIDLGFELEDGTYDWVVTGDPFDPFLGNTGDFNLDGTVDLTDWMILSDNFGTGASLRQGDINFDGAVNLQDAAEFHAAFTAGAAASVPEPATVSLLLAAVGLMLGTARRRRLR